MFSKNILKSFINNSNIKSLLIPTLNKTANNYFDMIYQN